MPTLGKLFLEEPKKKRKRKKSRRRKSAKQKERPQVPYEVLKDPLKLIKLCWPQYNLYDKQIEVIKSVEDNYETFVHAGNELGKDFIAALEAVVFFATRSPCRIVTSSAGETQLKAVLWGEMRRHIAASKYDFGWNVAPAGMLITRKKTGDKQGDVRASLSYIIGHVTKTVENFQGHHLPQDKPRVLAIFDEASGIPDAFFEAAESWAHRKLVIGNPLNTTNFFYRHCKRGDVKDVEEDNEYAQTAKLYRKVIHIGGEHSPNVRIGKELKKRKYKGPHPTIIPGVVSYVDYQRRSKFWDKIKATMRLHGRFYEGEEALLYPPHWLDKAEEIYKRINPLGYDKLKEWWTVSKQVATAMGVDGAAGRDLTCWTVINRRNLIEQFAIPTPDTMEIVATTVKYIDKYGLDPGKVCFDYGGGGKQIVDRLRQMGIKCRAVSFGESATPPRNKKIKRTEDKDDKAETMHVNKNRRAEMYWILREWMDLSVNPEPFGIPEELYLLREELAIMPLMYDAEGKFFLPPKTRPPGNKNQELLVISEMLGRSPDRADSLVLAAFAEEVPSPKTKVGAL